MKKRNTIIILAVLVIGLVALIVAGQGAKKSTFKQDYHIEDISSVTKLFLADKQDRTVLLTKGNAESDTIWMVNNEYEASQPMVNLLLETLNQMRIRQQVNKDAIPNVIKNISSSNVKCEVYQRVPFINWFGGRLQLFFREKKTVTYYVGNETRDNMGNFIFREGDKVPYIVHIPGFRGFLAPRFVTDASLLRSHRIVNLNVKQIQQVSLEITADQSQSFAINRVSNGFEFQLMQSKQVVPNFDTARVAQMLLSFNNLNFDEFANKVPKAELDTTFNRPPSTILTITDTTGIKHQLRTYIKYQNLEDNAKLGAQLAETFDLDRLYAIIDDRDTVLIQYFAFDNILQPASFFLGQARTSLE